MFKILLNLPRLLRSVLRSIRAVIRGPDEPAPVSAPVFHTTQAQYAKEFDESSVRVHFDKQAFNAIKWHIGQAKTSIEIQIFIWIADDCGREIAEMLVHAAKRGVKIVIRKEMTGDVFELHEDFGGTQKDPHPVWQALWTHSNIEVLHENHHDHSKVFIIDEETLLVGSMNIGDSFCNEWHENVTELHGAEFIRQYRTNGTTVEWPLKKGVTVVRSGPEAPMMNVVLPLLRSAKRMIQIEMAYFSDPEITDVILKKSHEGVFSFIVFPHTSDLHNHANMATAESLLQSARKNRVFIARYPRGLLHTKVIIVDSRTLFMGSTNLITSSLMKMCETNVLIHRRPRPAIRKTRRQFIKDSVRSVEVEKGGMLYFLWHSMLSYLQL